MRHEETQWMVPVAHPELLPGEIHVWRAGCCVSQEQLEMLRQLLSDEETRRSARFAVEQPRRQFVVAHAMLRVVLGRYMRIPPDRLDFYHSPNGKPMLQPSPNGGHHLHFNLSHAGDLVLCAVAYDREVGIDVELVRQDRCDLEAMERFFSPREVADLRSLPPQVQVQAFFRCWTRKEAFIKARGDGLSFPLDQFDVSVLPGEPARLLNVGPYPEETREWTLRDLDVAPGHVAALAVEGHAPRLSCWLYLG